MSRCDDVLPETPSRRRFLGLLMALGALPALAGGRSNAAPVRVVSLFQGATDTLVALGVTPVGVVESWQDKPIYPYLREALDGVTLVGLETQPSLEDIALLEPDLIVASRFRHQRIAPLLSALAPVAMLDDIYHYRRTLATLAGVLDREPRAAYLQARLAIRITALRRRLQARFADRWPLSVSLLDIRGNAIRSYLASSFGGSVLADLGFVWNRAARDADGVILEVGGVESLPALDADVFFVLDRSRSQAAVAHYRRLRGHPLWQRLSAPSHGRVWSVDPVAWSLSGGILGVFAMLDDVAAWLDAADEGRA
ncbi:MULTISPECIES: iron-siderophore ABC transporter substrate-binding protein [unclassified Modicisalibacter]|uniref:ABC transporter substrate-binding protein n=1 Tax=unclassified Modicisalibacter TaxID=2679913 RepID=UPI001CCB5130|nr:MULTISPECIES: iron-siderophore ABC transporter substrate-binding protein [unclassified Modicisalibacter]MBZ9558628.1 iron-siderophore ABC transporter substrate-binding protein [Modicisalibacter sp. R2A 31.J]MBZ9575480.1 iron-siderophore ABC transporter substrate-binding protein [Modicisalibacter sp. MOD 31.J]